MFSYQGTFVLLFNYITSTWKSTHFFKWIREVPIHLPLIEVGVLSAIMIDQDARGAKYVRSFVDFMTKEIAFHEMMPAPQALLKSDGSKEEGTLPLCLADKDRKTIALFFPRTDECQLMLDPDKKYEAEWFNPRTGKLSKYSTWEGNVIFTPKTSGDPRSDDWVLILRNK